MTPPAITFLAYQRQWLDDRARFKIGMFARQTGKTFTTCGEIVDDCVAAEIAQSRARWVILSRGERQAAEAMEEAVRPFCRGFAAAYRSLAAPEFAELDFAGDDDDGRVVRFKALEARFAGGSRITALPANPATARGYSANVFLDEFAFHQDSRAIWRALFPVISRPGLRLRVTSTPNGKNNKFYELWTGEDLAWSRHRVTIHDAVAQGLARDVAELKAAIGDEDAWRQEYELEFLDEASAWLPYDAIVACEHEDAGKPALYEGGPCLIGNDIARRGDLWVAFVWERVGDVLWCREIVELRHQSFAAQDAAVADLMARYRVERLVMDQTGMGEKPVEDARRRYGGAVEGVVMTAPLQLTIATAAKQAFEDRRVRIPAGRPELRADLHKLERVQGPTGAPRILTPRDEGGHADRAWAAFLGIAGAATEPGILAWYRAEAARNPEAAARAADFVAGAKAARDAARAKLAAGR